MNIREEQAASLLFHGPMNALRFQSYILKSHPDVALPALV
jgi:hypothetical protein